jgi:hypothetical protein
MHLQLFLNAFLATAALAMPVAAPCEANSCTEGLTRRYGGSDKPIIDSWGGYGGYGGRDRD